MTNVPIDAMSLPLPLSPVSPPGRLLFPLSFPSSGLHPLSLRVIKWCQVQMCRHRLVGDDEFVAAFREEGVADPLRAADIAITNRQPDSVAEAAAGEVAYR